MWASSASFEWPLYTNLTALVALHKPVKSGLSWPSTDFVKQNGYWLQVQLSVAIVSICLPTLRPLLPRGTTISTKLKTYYQSLLGLSAGSSTWSSRCGGLANKSASSGSIGERAKEYENLKQGSPDMRLMTNISYGGRSRHIDKTDAYPMHAIAVDHEVNIVGLAVPTQAAASWLEKSRESSHR